VNTVKKFSKAKCQKKIPKIIYTKFLKVIPSYQYEYQQLNICSYFQRDLQIDSIYVSRIHKILNCHLGIAYQYVNNQQ